MTNEIETISDISIPGTQGDMLYSYIGQTKRTGVICLVAWQPEEEETSHYLFYDLSSKTIVDYICTTSSMDRIFIDDTHIRFLPINQEDNVRNSIGELTYRSPIDDNAKVGAVLMFANVAGNLILGSGKLIVDKAWGFTPLENLRLPYHCPTFFAIYHPN